MNRFGGHAHPALRLADRLKLLPGSPVGQRFQRERRTFPLLGLPADFQCQACQYHRTPAQIVRRVRRTLQDSSQVERLQCGTDTSTDRLGTIGLEATGHQIEARRDRRNPRRQMGCSLYAAHLGGWADWDIYDDMGGPCGDFLGEDGGNKLALRIDVKFAFDTYENVISGTEMYRSAPDNAASFGLDYPLHGWNVEVDRSEGLHRVRGACRRGDGS